jgi:hypothetical protein
MSLVTSRRDMVRPCASILGDYNGQTSHELLHEVESDHIKREFPQRSLICDEELSRCDEEAAIGRCADAVQRAKSEADMEFRALALVTRAAVPHLFAQHHRNMLRYLGTCLICAGRPSLPLVRLRPSCLLFPHCTLFHVHPSLTAIPFSLRTHALPHDGVMGNDSRAVLVVDMSFLHLIPATTPFRRMCSSFRVHQELGKS